MRIVYVEELVDGRVRAFDLEPTPSELEDEAELRKRQERQARAWPAFTERVQRDDDARGRWRKTVVEHEVERAAQREGRGGHDE